MNREFFKKFLIILVIVLLFGGFSIFIERKTKESKNRQYEIVKKITLLVDTGDAVYRDDKSKYKKTIKVNSRNVIEEGSFFFEKKDGTSFSVDWNILNNGDINYSVRN